MKCTITALTRFTKGKDGQPLKTKDGRPYTRLNIKTVEYGDKYMSGFDNPQTKNWQEGDTVEIEVKENGEYLNFNVPKLGLAASFTDADRETLSRVLVLCMKIDAKLEILAHPPKDDYPVNDQEDTPF